ncbi:YecA family protein [Jeongeupia sp. HS-3]|uniref:YecA/YgfB family protein n=1 Tax=Jeongeupia sp. HS-3 TaxID=1009682 RepID=UPI00190FC2B5|nr:YecA family protein [Jeongeupia sp. HS-3]
MTDTLPAPLSEEELDRLDAFLMSPRTPAETMDLEMLDGFLVALAVGPEDILEDEWLPQVFDGTPPEFDDAIEAEETFSLIRRHAASVKASFAPKRRENIGEEPLYFPLVLSDEGADEKWQDSLGAYWASGFRAGLLAREEIWQAALDEDEHLFDSVASILALEEGHDADDETKPLTLKAREERISELPWIVEDVMFYWLEKKYGQVERVEREEPKTGRNDPCPCGSGKKFKKCHGA